MALRVNYGPCKQCGAPVVYQGAEYCSPRCQGAAYQQAVCAICRAPISYDKQLCDACSSKGAPVSEAQRPLVAATPPALSAVRTPELPSTSKRIDLFRGDYAFLSNFYSAPTFFEGLLHPTSEHAYQAAKSLDPRVREAVRQIATPAEAKRAGQRVPLRADWESIKLSVMRSVVRDKFVRNPELGKKLFSTESAELVEGNTWGDRFWGVYDGVGENWLGRILMEVREELQTTVPCSVCGKPTDSFLGTCASCEHEKKEPCPLCSGELAEGLKICATCASKVPVTEREILVLDVEAELITDERPLPPLVCTQFANASDYWIFHVAEARGPVEAALRSNALIVGHYVAFDMAAICAQWPDLIPLVFQAYADDRVTDTMLREKLVDIATGAYFDGIEYPLEKVVRSRCGIDLVKGDWQLRFGEVKHLPVASWPEEARHYAISDVVTTLDVYRKQEADRHWLLDQYRQARASFAFELMSAAGLHTDAAAVLAFRTQLETKYARLAEEMIAHGLMRKTSTKKKASGQIETKLVRTMKAVQARVAQAYTNSKKQVPRTAPTDKHLDGQVKTDADTCERSGDEVLKSYSDLSSTATLLSTYVPLLEQATTTPLHARFTSLLSTGRTSSSPNVQNLPTDEGTRECFVPRPGYVYIVSDYAGIELRTWAQVCWSLFKHSKMREALNAGVDAHTKLAARILNISYEQAISEYAEDRKGRVYKPRQASKALNFGKPGGVGWRSWREYARKNYGVDVSPEDAQLFVKLWGEEWTESEQYAAWCGAQCDVREDGLGQVEQMFVSRFRGGCRYTEYSNSLFQGLAADIAKHALWLVTKACYAEPSSPLFGSRPVNFVHDEIVTETPDNGRAHEAAGEQERLMLVAARKYLPDITNIEAETLLARRWSKAAKPVHDAQGRLIPWDFQH